MWKIRADQILQVKTKQPKKQAKFFTFSKVHMFFNRTFPGLWVKLLILLSHTAYKKSEELPLARLFEFFTGLWLSSHKNYDYVKHFVSVSVSLVINAGCVKRFLKNF